MAAPTMMVLGRSAEKPAGVPATNGEREGAVDLTDPSYVSGLNLIARNAETRGDNGPYIGADGALRQMRYVLNMDRTIDLIGAQKAKSADASPEDIKNQGVLGVARWASNGAGVLDRARKVIAG